MNIQGITTVASTSVRVTGPPAGSTDTGQPAPLGPGQAPGGNTSASSGVPGGAGAASQVSGSAGAQQSSPAPAPAGNAAGTAGTDTFLKLLVAQLRNQDPMQPMDNQAFITELAQFNTVEQMLNVNQAVNAQLSAQQATEAIGLIGKAIVYTVPGVGQAPSTMSQGTVSGVSTANGQVQLHVGTAMIPLSQVTSIGG